MSDYKRFVSYLFSYENGIKKENVGYARIENYKEQCKINIYMKDTIKREQKAGVYLFYREDERIKGIFIKDMEIKNGLGSCKIITNNRNIENSSYSFQQIGGIIIYLSSNRFWGTEWDDRPIYGFEPGKRSGMEPERKIEFGEAPKLEEKAETGEELKAELEIEPKEEAKLEEEAETREDAKAELEMELGEAPKAEFKIEPKPETKEEFKEEVKLEQKSEVLPREEITQAVAAANVEMDWNRAEERQQPQTERTARPEVKDRFAPYTKVYPFYEQSKECIGIQPKDLGKISPVLEQWQDNNFLLHGYGRFRHILLLRRKGNQGEEYFIGVPGMYRPREEELAVTYGFSLFVPMKKEKAEYGDFGYWCAEVKLPETD